jgi:hypothetical protein
MALLPEPDQQFQGLVKVQGVGNVSRWGVAWGDAPVMR